MATRNNYPYIEMSPCIIFVYISSVSVDYCALPIKQTKSKQWLVYSVSDQLETTVMFATMLEGDDLVDQSLH